MSNIIEPDWTAEIRNREKGETTLKQCGWCKFAGCGTHRYGAMLQGSCDLMKRYGNEVQWKTPCKIVGLGKADLKAIVESKGYEIEEAKRSIKSTQDEIKELEKLARKAENVPPLPDSRSCDHFPLKERVWVFIQANERVPVTRWYVGTVVNGYRSGDGYVSYVLDDLPKSKEGWGCGHCVPSVMLDWEFQYFKKNPAKLKEWLNGCGRSYNGDRMPMAELHKALIAAK